VRGAGPRVVRVEGRLSGSSERVRVEHVVLGEHDATAWDPSHAEVACSFFAKPATVPTPCGLRFPRQPSRRFARGPVPRASLESLETYAMSTDAPKPEVRTGLVASLALAGFLLGSSAVAGAGDAVSEELEAKLTALFEKVASGSPSECKVNCMEAEKASKSEKTQKADWNDPKYADCGIKCLDYKSATEHLAKVLASTEGAWTVVEPKILATFEGEGCCETRARVVDLLAWTPSEHSVVLGERIFASSPSYFGENQILALAETGSKRMCKELEQRVTAGKAESVLPAAFLAMHGSDVGRPQLEKAAKACYERRGDLARQAAVLVGLSKLNEACCMEAFCSSTNEAVLAALDGGEIERAREMAVEAEFVHDALSSDYGFKLAYLDERVAWQAAQRAPELETPAQIFELMEKLAQKQ